MKWLILILSMGIPAVTGAQAYIPMPADSGATWRYRVYDIDYITQVIDNIIFLNGADTVAHGNTYHKLMSRSCRQVGGAGFDPAIVSIEANAPDTYYGAMREAAKRVYLLTGAGEQLVFDFNALPGDSIPGSASRVLVTATDSLWITGSYHKRYLTSDPGYRVIEGIGSNRGLIPDINDGTGTTVFYCFTNGPENYTPDTFPCTTVYPIGYRAGVPTLNLEAAIHIYPVPASQMLCIDNVIGVPCSVKIADSYGRVVWRSALDKQLRLTVSAWLRGIYYFSVCFDNVPDGYPLVITRKILIQ